MIQRRVSRAALLLCALAAALTLGACGWQLRGAATLPASVSPVHIQGRTAFDPMAPHLAEALQAAGVALADSRAGAASVLRILGGDEGRRVLSVDGRGKGLEYELYQILEIELTGEAGAQLVAPQRLVAREALLNPEIETLGKQREEQDLREAMREDLAWRVVRRLESQLR
jgi:LPS-assembly lipoprotein